MSSEEDHVIDEITNDWVGATIKMARDGHFEAHLEITGMFGRGEPDERIYQYVLGWLTDEELLKVRYPVTTRATSKTEGRDKRLAREVVRRQRMEEANGGRLSEMEAIATVAKDHANEGVSQSLVKKAFEKHRKAAQLIEMSSKYYKPILESKRSSREHRGVGIGNVLDNPAVEQQFLKAVEKQFANDTNPINK